MVLITDYSSVVLQCNLLLIIPLFSRTKSISLIDALFALVYPPMGIARTVCLEWQLFALSIVLPVEGFLYKDHTMPLIKLSNCTFYAIKSRVPALEIFQARTEKGPLRREIMIYA